MTDLNCSPYIYPLTFDKKVIQGVHDRYFSMFGGLGPRHSDAKCNGHKVAGLDDIPREFFPNISEYLTDKGLVMYLPPKAKTNIHIDRIVNSTIERNICLNFPIINTESITEFFEDPDFKFHYNVDTFYTTGIYKTPPDPVVSFRMPDSAVLFNTAKYHHVINNSLTDTRILLSISFDVSLGFDECLSILRDSGYAV